MGRSDDAKIWARVLSELAQVPVAVEWERPAWRVRSQDGPTRRVLMDRTAALSRYRVASSLPFAQLRFTRSDSPLAVALSWLARGSPESPARDAVAEVETWCAEVGYPQSRFDDRVLAAGELLSRLGQADGTEMGVLLARAQPPVPAQRPVAAPGPDLRGRVVTYRWPNGGPPDELLGPARPTAAGPESTDRAGCQHCGKPLDSRARCGRPAKYCSGACRTRCPPNPPPRHRPGGRLNETGAIPIQPAVTAPRISLQLSFRCNTAMCPPPRATSR